MEVHCNPFRDVRDVELLVEGKIKRIENQAPAKWIDEQRGDRCCSCDDELTDLRGCPAGGFNSSPSAPDKTRNCDQGKQDQPERPGAMSVDPQTEQRWQQPQGSVAALTEALQDYQQDDEIEVSKKDCAWPIRDGCDRGRKQTGNDRSLKVAALLVTQVK